MIVKILQMISDKNMDLFEKHLIVKVLSKLIQINRDNIVQFLNQLVEIALYLLGSEN